MKTAKLKKFCQNNWHYLMVLIFGLIVTAALWSSLRTVIYGYDFTFHIARMQSSVHAWQNGQLLPQVDPRGAEGFGYAYNLFYGPLVTYVSAAFRLVSNGWAVAVNLSYVFWMILSGFVMCYTVVKITKNKTWAALAGIFYLFMPCHLLNLYLRMSAGEVAAMAVSPLLMLGLYQLVNQEKGAVRNIVIAATGMLLTHSATTLLFALMAVIYLLLNIKQVWNLKSLRRMVLAGIIILGLSAFFLLPMLEAKLQGNYGIFDTTYSKLQFWASADHLNWRRLGINDLLWNDGFDLKALFPHGWGIGIIAMIGLFGFPWTAKKIENRKVRKFTWSIYILAIISLVMTTNLIKWQYMPSALYVIQFPWRFLSQFNVFISIVAGWTIYSILLDLRWAENRALVVVIGLLAALNVASIFALPFQEQRYPVDTLPPLEIIEEATGSQVEYAPLQLLCATETPEECNSKQKVTEILGARGDDVRIVVGSVEINDIERNELKFQLWVKTESEAKIEFPLIWYPGYKATLDGKKLEARASEKYGFVEVSLPGDVEGELKIYYGMSTATVIGVIITSITTLGCVSWMTYPCVKRWHSRVNRDSK